MPLFKADCAWVGDASSGSVLARDWIHITPYFFSSSGSPGYAALATSLHEMMSKTGDATSWRGGACETHVALYAQQLTGGKTGPPVYESSANVGTFATSSCPREVALCLSFYGQQNQPGYRGRLYFPWSMRPGSDTPGVRPTQGYRDFTLTMADKLAAAGGTEWGWVVYSRTRQNFIGVSHAWVDDEWDTQRRRQLRATTRSEKNITG